MAKLCCTWQSFLRFLSHVWHVNSYIRGGSTGSASCRPRVHGRSKAPNKPISGATASRAKHLRPTQPTGLRPTLSWHVLLGHGMLRTPHPKKTSPCSAVGAGSQNVPVPKHQQGESKLHHHQRASNVVDPRL